MTHTRTSPLLLVLLLTSGLVGTTTGAVMSAVFDTGPAWLGPALLMGGLALVLVAALLAPAALRAWRARKAR